MGNAAHGLRSDLGFSHTGEVFRPLKVPRAVNYFDLMRFGVLAGVDEVEIDLYYVERVIRPRKAL